MLIAIALWLFGVQAGTGQSAGTPSVPAVVLQVTLPAGSVVQVTVPPGKIGSVGSVLGPRLDLSPSLSEDGSLELGVTAVIWDPATNTTSSLDAGRQVVRQGDTARFADGIFPIGVKWMGTVMTPALTGPSTAGSDTDRCCVVCGSVMTCGCRVVTPCGDCCGASCACQDGSIRRDQ